MLSVKSPALDFNSSMCPQFLKEKKAGSAPALYLTQIFSSIIKPVFRLSCHIFCLPGRFIGKIAEFGFSFCKEVSQLASPVISCIFYFLTDIAAFFRGQKQANYCSGCCGANYTQYYFSC